MPDDAIVYIVDDDDSVRKATSRLLRAAGLKVLAFESAEELLGYPMPESAGCLILDYQMPGRNGIELQKDLMAAGIALPVVFLSGEGDIPISVTAMKQGAVDFLPKPVDDQLLVDTVRKAIAAHRLELIRINDVKEFKRKLSFLTRREHEVLLLVIEGLLNKQIAARLGVTEATIKVHRGRMMEKIGADSVAELVRLCERGGNSRTGGT